jgi:UDP-glucose 4-epimerase
MRVVITGASGNVGTSVIRALQGVDEVDEILGLARRLPTRSFEKVTWAQADVTSSDLEPHFRGADAVVHLAWLIQPSRDTAVLRRTNVEGSARVFHAAGGAGVPRLVHASSVGAYSPGPKDRRVDESWATGGIQTSAYSRHKSEVERLLDRFEAERPEVRVARLRPGLIFKREAASEIRRYFAGPLLPNPLLRRELIPVTPDTERLRFQAVHAHDVGDAYRLAVVNDDAAGAFNVAAEPVLDGALIAELFGARPVHIPSRVLRAAATTTWRLRMQPTDASWLDLALQTPLMDVSRARAELGWTPRRSAPDALSELVDGMRAGAGLDTPPLATDTGGPARLRELATGVGARTG